MSDTNYLSALRALLPGAPDYVLYGTDADLQNVERTLAQIVGAASQALDDLRGAKDETRTNEERFTALATVVSLSESAGASGPLGSQVEKMIVAAAKAATTFNVAHSMLRAAEQAAAKQA